mmetsp:Transcript_118416/g.235859  ORF Transcript_118416/g.235859 Transcript_118416/m.235859 type:complete len:93 (+) Transcript_118416:254-532(+)
MLRISGAVVAWSFPEMQRAMSGSLLMNLMSLYVPWCSAVAKQQQQQQCSNVAVAAARQLLVLGACSYVAEAFSCGRICDSFKRLLMAEAGKR